MTEISVVFFLNVCLLHYCSYDIFSCTFNIHSYANHCQCCRLIGCPNILDLVFLTMMDSPRVACQIPGGKLMILNIRDHFGHPRPVGVAFDSDQLVPGLLCGVAAAAGTHDSTTTNHNLTVGCWMLLIELKVKSQSRWRQSQSRKSLQTLQSSSHDLSLSENCPANVSVLWPSSSSSSSP